jgi:uncharacterized repeat protein (TIGR01451 family)
MKKGFLFTLLLVLGSICSGWAQWEKIFVNNLNSSYRTTVPTNSLAVYNDTIIISKIVNDNSAAQFYFSIDYGKNWRKLNMPKDLPVWSHLGNQICMNKLGIFYSSTSLSGKTQIYHSKDFGSSWRDTTFYTNKAYSLMESHDTLMYLKLSSGSDKSLTIYAYRNNKWSYYGQGRTLSENRFLVDSSDYNYVNIFDAVSKARIASVKVTENAYSEDPITFAKDSIIVNFKTKRRGDTLKTIFSVSLNLGKTWKVREYEFKSGINVLFDKRNKIYVRTYNDVYMSDNGGESWQSIVDSIKFTKFPLSTNDNNIFDNLMISDSTLFVMNQSYLYYKKNDINWTYANNATEFLDDVIQISDSIYWARTGSAYVISKDKGKTWGFICLEDYGKIGKYFYFDKTLYKIFALNFYKSSDWGKQWSIDTTTFLNKKTISYNNPLIIGDSLIFKPDYYRPLELFTKSSNKWQTLVNTDSVELIYNYKTLFSEGYIYGEQWSSSKSLAFRYDIKSGKKEIIFKSESIQNILAHKNKIWVKHALDSLSYSENYGINWVTYRMPYCYTYSLYNFKDILVLNTENKIKISDKYSPEIYVSVDNGKSWNLYVNGIRFPNEQDASTLKADSSIFVNCSKYGVYRLSINDIQLKSISGTVFIDKNKNGIKDTDEKGFPNAKVFLSNAGAFTTTDSLGNYAFLADLKATDTLKASIDSKYATYTPQYLLVSQSDTVKNIGVFIPANLQDLVVNGTAITPPRSGFTNSYLLTYKNVGAITKSGKVIFAYNAKQTYIEATQAPTSNVNNTLSWDYANLQPNESRTLKVTFKTAADVPIRTQLTNVATIEPIATDTFKTDNVDSLFQIVVGSYDPNDKQVSFLNTRQAPSVIDPNSEMTYTIRFQNTGNYQADFVRVTDTLSDKLDLTTLRVLATSHNYTLSVKNKNVLQFEFNPIYLPDSMTSEANSHGFIKFAIKPKKTLTKDEVIKNTAYIFFDYNPAIITNTVETANQKVNGLFTPSVLESLSVFPNPTNGEISFSLDKYQGKALSINVYSIDGKLMMNKHTIGEAVNRINGESLSNGLYVLQVRVGDDIVFGKFMVQK